MIELDRSLATPIYTPDAARRWGWSEADITRVFGVQTLKQSTYTAPVWSYNEGRERGQLADVLLNDGQTIGTWLDKRGVERTEQGMYVFYIAIREDSHGVDRGQELESKPEDVKLDKQERIARLELRPTQIDANDKAILREDLRW